MTNGRKWKEEREREKKFLFFFQSDFSNPFSKDFEFLF
jgi:hypothetical protein